MNMPLLRFIDRHPNQQGFSIKTAERFLELHGLSCKDIDCIYLNSEGHLDIEYEYDRDFIDLAARLVDPERRGNSYNEPAITAKVSGVFRYRSRTHHRDGNGLQRPEGYHTIIPFEFDKEINRMCECDMPLQKSRLFAAKYGFDLDDAQLPHSKGRISNYLRSIPQLEVRVNPAQHDEIVLSGVYRYQNTSHTHDDSCMARLGEQHDLAFRLSRPF